MLFILIHLWLITDMDYNLVIQLLSELRQYEQEMNRSPDNIHSFATWLINKRDFNDAADESSFMRINWHGKDRGGKAHYNASHLITAVGRHKMNYIRQALDGTAFDTYDEFAFMLSLVFKGNYSPSKLIETHLQLKPTGIEVIRRLLKKQLVEQTPSETDKRAKVLSATTLGKQAFYLALQRINKVTDLIMSPLSEKEHLVLLSLLQKLDQRHRPIYSLDKKSSFDELISMFESDNPQYSDPKNEK